MLRNLMLVLLVLAADPKTSPPSRRGQAVFGLIVASVTMVLRMGFGLAAAPYYALLVAGAILTLTRRRGKGSVQESRCSR